MAAKETFSPGEGYAGCRIWRCKLHRESAQKAKRRRFNAKHHQSRHQLVQRLVPLRTPITLPYPARTVRRDPHSVRANPRAPPTSSAFSPDPTNQPLPRVLGLLMAGLELPSNKDPSRRSDGQTRTISPDESREEVPHPCASGSRRRSITSTRTASSSPAADVSPTHARRPTKRLKSGKEGPPSSG